MNKPPYIVEHEIGEAVAATKTALALPVLNYQYGYIQEIDATLATNAKTKEQAEKSFPIVILKAGYRVVKGKFGYYGVTNGLDIIVATNTKAEYKAAKRIDEKFSPVLIPIAEELLYQIGRRLAFGNAYPYRMPHGTINAYFFGNQKEAAVSDILDAIIIPGIELNVKNNPNCTEPTLAGAQT